ncbi:hypothetical protein LRAMOSA01490 [Lichtheimia ramosa]|uniref:Uncharacterized protein n=1 Tax=Lichtheimia ramosa TaxID=688394 RepID=A0A077WIH9_9FUNG|nr:hypothetical protein LRAMOSA01490 [Lichtheimia ramosa]
MQSTLEANRVSNWTVALMLGASAALRSGSQGGIVGELPFCDLVLTLDTQRITNGVSGENVFYGRDTHWARMIIKSFRSRRLDFSYVLLDKDAKCPHYQCVKHGCLMARDPLEEKRKKREQKLSNKSCNMTSYGTEVLAQPGEGDLSDMSTPVEETSINMNNSTVIQHPHDKQKLKDQKGTMTDPTGDHSASIQPNMLYGLCKDYHGEDGDYKVVHKEECIKEMTIDIRAIEFLSVNLREKLRGKTYLSALNLCQDIIEKMCETVNTSDKQDVTPWDKRIIDRVRNLMFEYPHLPKAEADSVWNEAMDRIHSRIPDMLKRLGYTSFEVENDGASVNYSIDDLSGAFLVFFGIKRAMAMSHSLYEHDSLIFMGYNASTGHDVIRDLTEVPSQNVDGFSSRLVIESTSKVRVVEKDIEPSHIFRLAILLDTVISIAIMMLTFIGPMLSMYGARLWTSSYRESYMRMGTTMRWSVAQVSMMHSGQARDDWMVCIKPVSRRNRYVQTMGFFLLSLLSSVATIVLWPFFHPTLVFPFTTFSRAICIVSCIVGVPWVILAQTVFKAKASDDDEAEAEKKKGQGLLSKIFSIRSVHSVINIGFVSLLIIFAGVELERTWLYLYVLEAIYALQWLCGELTDEWVYESTALFMLGALSALRLTNLPSS